MHLRVSGGHGIVDQRRIVDEWSLLCSIWKANKKDGQEGSDHSKAREVREKAHALCRCS
jgi:hypothetical protein